MARKADWHWRSRVPDVLSIPIDQRKPTDPPPLEKRRSKAVTFLLGPVKARLPPCRPPNQELQPLLKQYGKKKPARKPRPGRNNSGSGKAYWGTRAPQNGRYLSRFETNGLWDLPLSPQSG